MLPAAVPRLSADWKLAATHSRAPERSRSSEGPQSFDEFVDLVVSQRPSPLFRTAGMMR
jgi:hypothetical protein